MSRGIEQDQSGKAKQISGTVCRYNQQLPPQPRQIEREQGKEPLMIAAAPIRVLSNRVEINAASAVSEFFEICQTAKPESGYVALPPDLQQKIVSLNRKIEQIVQSQAVLLAELDKVTADQLASPSFQKVLEDLGRLVAQGNSAISDTYDAPEIIVRLLRNNLDVAAEQYGHIDNYLESFRIAFDETCSAVLADLATRVFSA
jgi:hypothetical protein